MQLNAYSAPTLDEVNLTTGFVETSGEFLLVTVEIVAQFGWLRRKELQPHFVR